MFDTLEKIGRNYVPLALTSLGKKMIAYPRYVAQFKEAKKDFEKYKDQYPQHTLFVGGMPKSGSTWMKKMLCTIPGFSNVMIPEAVYYDENAGVSYDFDFPEDTFERLKGGLSVLKLHSHGSDSNFKILEKNNIKFVVLYRDLRDVAVSYSFYVRGTRHNVQHKRFVNSSTKEILMAFGKEYLPEFVKWVDSWHRFKDHPLCYIVDYEKLRANPHEQIANILEHYGIEPKESLVNDIVEKNSFKALSGGRKEGQGDKKSFFRKGISGDWRNHFDDELSALYDPIMKDFLAQYYPDQLK